MKTKSIIIAATTFLHLKGPDGILLYDDGKKVGITLYGPGTSQSARVQERQSARIESRLAENDGRFTLAPHDVRRAEQAEDWADQTAEFHHLEHDGPDGQPLSGRDLFVAAYSDPSLGWITDQVQNVIGKWGKFATASTPS